MRAIASANAVAPTALPSGLCPVWPSGLLERLFYNLGRSRPAVNTAKTLGFLLFIGGRRPPADGPYQARLTSVSPSARSPPDAQSPAGSRSTMTSGFH